MRHSSKSSIIFLASFILLAFAAQDASAQATKVKGRVVDAVTGEGIPFAGVYFKNSTVGVSADLEGYFNLETRTDTLTLLSASILGYQEQVLTVIPHRFNEISFRLVPLVDELNAAVVKPDNRYMKYILGRIQEAKDRNDPERRPYYDCEAYTRNELDLTNPQNAVLEKLLPESFKFIYEYLDTSVVSGQPYLPVMIAESSSRYYHSSDPLRKKEIIKASRMSGLKKEKTITQFTGNMYIKTNFYENYINILDVEIPSPLHKGGMTYYNYYLVDSLNIDGRKTYKIRFHPSKWVSAPTLDGEMSIDAEDFALRDIHCRLKNGANVNWVRALTMNVENQRLEDSTWFYKQDRIYVDAALSTSDSSKLMSFIASRQIDYSDPSFNESGMLELLDRGAPVLVRKNSRNNDEDYWAKVRPYPLSKKEQGIYNMVDSIKNVSLYKSIETLANTFANGFINFKYLGIGPYSSLYSFNELEGSRVQFGVKTTKDISRKFRFMGYMAYGFKDEAFKGGGLFEYHFNNQPTRKLAFSYKHDVLQLGAGSFAFGNGDIMNSILTKRGGRKLSMIDDFSASYEHEWTQDVNMTFALESRRIFSNEFVPMVRTDGTWYESVGYNQAHVRFRLSKDQIITRGTFGKSYFYTKYPVLTLDLAASMKGIGKNDYTFLRPEMRVEYKWLVPPFGESDFDLRAGTIIGTVPYPLLKVHEGNGTYALHRHVFACMNPYEFASDTWATIFWEHNFKGFFLGKVPLLRRMNLREIAILRAAYGTVRDENNGILGDNGFGSEMLFPAGMKKLDTPYVEMGVGISNILRLIRIDFVWRMTHRFDFVDGVRVPHDNRFVVNAGFELKF